MCHKTGALKDNEYIHMILEKKKHLKFEYCEEETDFCVLRQTSSLLAKFAQSWEMKTNILLIIERKRQNSVFLGARTDLHTTILAKFAMKKIFFC